MKQEPAERLLSMTPDRETDLGTEGFLSALYRPREDKAPGKALILVGGSDGYFSLTKLIAEQFAQRGQTVLALAFWAREGLPTALKAIPLETVEKAGLWLRSLGYEKIGIWGISMGAQLALLSGAYLPGLLSCVVASNPLCVCGQAIQKKNAWHKTMCTLPGSAFTFRGKDIPFAPLTLNKRKVLFDCIRSRQLSLRTVYNSVITDAPTEAFIPVENIQGPLLLLAAEEDSMWPSLESARSMEARRKQHGLPVTLLSYTYASHFLLPYPLNSRRMFYTERKYPDECGRSNRDALHKTLDFLRDQW